MSRSVSFLALIAALSTAGCMRAVGPDIETSSQVQPAEQFDGGLALAGAGDLIAATERLVEVREVCGDSPLGRQALLLMSVIQLDGRNSSRNPDLAAELAATYLALPSTFRWTGPIAEAIYVVALELGAHVPSLTSAEAPGAPGPDRFGVGLGGDALVASDQWIPGRSVGLAAAAADYPSTLLEERVRLAARSANGLPLTAAMRERCETAGADSEAVSRFQLPQFDGSTVPGRLRVIERDRARLRSKVAELEDELERVRKTLRR